MYADSRVERRHLLHKGLQAVERNHVRVDKEGPVRVGMNFQRRVRVALELVDVVSGLIRSVASFPDRRCEQVPEAGGAGGFHSPLTERRPVLAASAASPVSVAMAGEKGCGGPGHGLVAACSHAVAAAAPSPCPMSGLSVLNALDPSVQQVLATVVAAAAPLRVALVGGAVRDLLLHRVHNDPWRGLPDLDLVVEEGGAPGVLPAAHRVVERLRQEVDSGLGLCQLHPAYGTAELEIDGVMLDLATARGERYASPGANPTVFFGALEDDLARRDLSVNAMALVLADGTLLDPHGGLVDLASRRLRFLHACSLADDPTRLVRAARYGARLGMDLAPESLQQWNRTLAAWPWSACTVPSLGTRLRRELELLLGCEPWPLALHLLQAWQGLELLAPELQGDTTWLRRLRWADRLLAEVGLPTWSPGQWRLLALLAALEDPLPLASRLQLPERSLRALRGLGRLPADDVRSSPAALSKLLERKGLPVESVILALACGAGLLRPMPGGPLRRGLLRWLLRWRSLPPPCTATQLMEAGVQPGPELGARLRALRAERLDRERW